MDDSLAYIFLVGNVNIINIKYRINIFLIIIPPIYLILFFIFIVMNFDIVIELSFILYYNFNE